MLSQNSVNEALAIAGSANFSDRVGLNPEPNTFLDTLVGLTKTAIAEYEVSCRASADGSVAPKEEYCFAPGDGLLSFARGEWSESYHNDLIDSQVLAIIEVASRNIHLARTDARPLLKKLYEDFNQVLNPDIPYAYSQMEIVPLQWTPIWGSDYIRNIANDFKNAYDTKEIPRGIIVSTDEEQYKDFLELSKTGLPGVDGMLQKTVANFTTVELEKLFNDAFYEGFLPHPSAGSTTRVDSLVLIHVWATKLLDMPPSKSMLTLASYKEALSYVIARTGFRIWELTETRRKMNEVNQVVVEYQGDYRVVVNGDIYGDWLKQGGTPEVVMGGAISSLKAKPLLAGDLLELKDRLVTEWNSHVSVTSKRDQENKLFQARGEFHRLLAALIDARANDGFVDSRDAAYDRLNLAMHALPYNFVKDPYPFLRDAMCTVLYPESDILVFLTAQDDECERNSDIDADDAATLATIEYLTDWIAKFIRRSYM